VFDFVPTQKLVERAGICHRTVVFSTPDPKQSQFLIRNLRARSYASERLFEFRRPQSGTEARD
jgi:hypothetical protein